MNLGSLHLKIEDVRCELYKADEPAKRLRISQQLDRLIHRYMYLKYVRRIKDKH